MNLGTFRTRYEHWRRTPALVILAGLLIVLALACWSPSAAPSPKLRTSPGQHSDLQLYRDIIVGVADGGDYYQVAAKEQRAANYPVQPFYTFRLPTHAMIYATAGERVMIGIIWLLGAAVMIVWWRRLHSLLPLPLLGASMFFLAGGLGGLMQPVTGLFHESWAGLLLALMIAIRRPSRPWPAIIAGGAALMVRELALPMILAMGGLALIEKRWRETTGWLAVMLAFAAYLTIHAGWVAEVVRPGDLASQGWNSMLGLQFAMKSIAKVTFGIRLPDALAAALLVLSLFGWASVRASWALRATLLLLGYALMLGLFARADTFYWALIAAPLAYVGLAFLPRALRRMTRHRSWAMQACACGCSPTSACGRHRWVCRGAGPKVDASECHLLPLKRDHRVFAAALSHRPARCSQSEPLSLKTAPSS